VRENIARVLYHFFPALIENLLTLMFQRVSDRDWRMIAKDVCKFVGHDL
jgi:hypothetical protein